VRVFADTSGLYAAVVGNDEAHDAAHGILVRLLEEGREIHTTSYVLLETMALLQARVSLEKALEFDAALGPFLTIQWVAGSLHARAVARLASPRGGRRVSLVDATSFVAMEDLGIEKAFAFDSHFRDEGFEILES